MSEKKGVNGEGEMEEREELVMEFEEFFFGGNRKKRRIRRIRSITIPFRGRFKIIRS